MSRGTAARHCAFGRNLHSKCSKCSSSRPYENILGVSWKVRMQTPQAHAHCTSSKGDKSNCARNSAFRYPTALRSAPRPAARADFSNGQDPFTPPPTYNELAASALAGERPHHPALQLHLQFSVLRRRLTTHVTCGAGAAKPKRKSATRTRCSRAVRSRVYTAPGK